MATHLDPAPKSEAAEGGQNAQPPRPSYARLARQISAYTSKGLLSAVVLLAGLGFGRQVLQWWAADDADSAVALQPMPMADRLGDPGQLHELRFGNQSWSLHRQSIAGNKPAAAAALRANCRQVVQHDRLPVEKPQKSEQEFLAQLAARQPIDQEPGKWQLFELNRGLPMVVGTRKTIREADKPTTKNLVELDHRVVTWGLAVPVSPSRWTLCTFQVEPDLEEEDLVTSAVPLPPRYRRVLSMKVAGGGAVIAFEGPSQVKKGIDFYEDWFAGHGWKLVDDRQRAGSGWHGRYITARQVPAQTVDIHFGTGRDGRCAGLLMITPSPSGREKKEEL